MLKDFLKPKWQHRDPSVRREAVAALGDDEMDLLRRIVVEDDAAEVRREALARLADMDLLRRVQLEDPDPGTRALALDRVRRLLCGAGEHAPALAERTAFLERHGEPDYLEFVALEGVEPELRRAAQERVTRETLLGRVAVADPALANREAALARIETPATLEEVARESRKRDKQIYREAFERLEAIRRAEERAAFVREEGEQLCAALEAMGRAGGWAEALDRLPGLEERWGAIESEVEPPLADRYAAAHAAVMEASAPYREARAAREAAWAAAAAGREALIEEADGLGAQLSGLDALDAGQEAVYAGEIERLQAAWAALGDLPADRSAPLDERFQAVLALIGRRTGELADLRATNELLDSLAAEAEQLLDAKRPILEKEVKRLEEQWRKTAWPAGADALQEKLERLEALDRRLRKRLAHQREQRVEKLEQLPEQLETLTGLLGEKHVKEAVPLHDRILGNLNFLEAVGVPREQLSPFQKRLHDMDPELVELRRWQAWGADDVRERLCEEMESLIGSELAPPELAERIRHLRGEWNQLRADGGSGLRTLRKRFDHAAEQAYTPCEAYFKQQAAERASNLERKRALIGKLEQFLAESDWESMEWKGAVRFQRQLAKAWRDAGPVDRREAKAVNRAYDKGMETLQSRLGEEHRRNLEARRALIERVKALAEVEDVGAAIEQCKALQREWVVTVPGRRKQENTAWEAFRAACDAVFLRRKQQQDAVHERAQQQRDAQKGVCEAAERLTACGIDELEEAERRLHKLAGEWKTLTAGARRRPELGGRFEAARKAFRAHAETLRRRDASEQLQRLKRRADCSLRAEALLARDDPTGAAAALEALEAEWRALPPLREAADEEAVRARFDRAAGAALAGGGQRAALLDELEAGRETLERLCLRMEILSGVESPPEARQARLAFQTDRLTRAMGGGDADPIGTPEEIEREWCLTGGVPGEAGAALQARFERACGGKPAAGDEAGRTEGDTPAGESRDPE